MFKKIKTKSLGGAIADRVRGFTVWDKLPKKILKKHPTDYILCPDFRVAIPKVLIKETFHTFTVKIVAKTKPALRRMLNHVVACVQEDVIMGDKRFECCGYKESTVKIGVYMADLLFTFKLRQLSCIEIKEIEKSKMTEENNG